MQKVKNFNRKNQNSLIKIIGGRMKEARELCNISQTKAAEALGYKNSGRLSKLENAMHTSTIPLWVIPKAAQYYDVSVDYLFGLVDDFETGAYLQIERDTSAWIFDTWQRQRAKDMQILAMLNKKIDAINNNIAAIEHASAEVTSAFDAFLMLNKEFDDLKGGARLQKNIHQLRACLQNTKQAVKKFKLECKAAKIHQDDRQKIIDLDNL